MEFIRAYFNDSTRKEWVEMQQREIQQQIDQQIEEQFAKNVSIEDVTICVDPREIEKKMNVSHKYKPSPPEKKTKVRFNIGENKVIVYKWTAEQRKERSRLMREQIIRSRRGDM